MLSLGELLDKLVIENIKLAVIRERLNRETLDDEVRVVLNVKMQDLNRS